MFETRPHLRGQPRRPGLSPHRSLDLLARFTRVRDSGRLVKGDWVAHASRVRYPELPLAKSPHFNLVTKYFADNSRQGCRLRLRRAPPQWFEIRESLRWFNALTLQSLSHDEKTINYQLSTISYYAAHPSRAGQRFSSAGTDTQGAPK